MSNFQLSPDLEAEKVRVAARPVQEIEASMVMGVEAGSTAVFAVREVAQRLAARPKITATVTSEATEPLAWLNLEYSPPARTKNTPNPMALILPLSAAVSAKTSRQTDYRQCLSNAGSWRINILFCLTTQLLNVQANETCPRSGRKMLFALLLASIVGLSGCDDRKPAQQGAAPAVTVASPLQRRITEWDEYTGRFQAVETVEIRARVDGYLESISFTDGQIVKKGDPLFVIDPRPYQATADSASDALSQARARLDLANLEQQRARVLAKTQYGSVESLDKATQEQRAATGAVQAAEATLRRAQLDVEFTHVASPVAGRAGRHLVSVGNLISGGEANSTLLTTIVSLDPIHFYFEADQNSYLKYERLAQSGQRPSSRDVANPVRLSLADETDFHHEGHMDFVDNQIDLGTGTIRARAVFDNRDLVFTPGMFARLRLIGAPPHDALLLPDEAVGTDQARHFVYVVGADNIATYREVKLGPIIDGLRVVRDGVSAEDHVIVDGLQRVRAGAPVTAQGANAKQAGLPQ